SREAGQMPAVRPGRCRSGGLGKAAMSRQPNPAAPASARRFPFLAALVLGAALVSWAGYANLAFAGDDPAGYRFFSPFQPYVNVNTGGQLWGEYINIAQALVTGEGFAHPFGRPTGPTAWMPPALPAILAGLLWVCDGNRHAVLAVVIVLQVYVLIGTGLL